MGSDNQKRVATGPPASFHRMVNSTLASFGLDTLGNVAHGTGVIHEQIGAELHGLGFQMGYR
ncbi:hypothetical protein GCM10007416_07390 [Kroppenstedtia guangzhouensis]|uniref:Uncharacterized protein n=1 Tax=Kroppenstedtia guangzhouensis TaxID=1274356 RepID=A0ABQ1G4L6_9BACL|nr:hypothetical protein [Kroppenstedtia guangzhouensis]GGA36951.1 hypothetical protein GCM10007416_07390 [Kroppenstedtia guangzhouensis]